MKKYEVTNKLSKELVEKLDNDRGIFYRFQIADWAIEGEYAESWETIFASREEALEYYEDEEYMDEEEIVLPGKSCMTTFEEIMQFDHIMNDDCVLMAFAGVDTGVSGHDDEYVAEFCYVEEIFSIEDVVNFYKENYEG